MGERFEFVCGKCGYSAEVSGGGDAGEVALTNTIVCETCRCLYDVIVLDMRQRPHIQQPEQCPKSPKHNVSPWQSGGPCPKCGTPMEKGGMVFLWD